MAGRTRCPVCGVATADPWPSENDLERAYADWYRPASGRFSGFGDALLRWTRALPAGRIDRIAPPGPILDVGAGDGALIDGLRARGREVAGIERDEPRADIRKGNLDEGVAGAQAAVVFWHSLEHLPEPSQALEAAVLLLRPSGVLILAAPNSASLQARVFGDRWFALDPPRHLIHLTTGALLDRLRSLGLVIEHVGHLRGGQVVFGWLHGLTGRLPGRPNLYEAIRRPQARSRPLSGPKRLAILIAGFLMLPFALLATAIEVVARRGGSVYVEARCA